MPMAMAYPVSKYPDFAAAAPTCDSGTRGKDQKQLGEETIKKLMQQGYSRGYAKSLKESTDVFAHRFWIVDNSGSMQKEDGHRMAETRNRNTVKMIPCSRFEEIQECATYHIQLSALLEAPTRFRVSTQAQRLCLLRQS